MPLPVQKLGELRDLMQQMLREAQHGNWSELTRLDSKRRVLVDYPVNREKQSIQNTSLPTDKAARLNADIRGSSSERDSRSVALIKEILKLDQQIMETTQKARQTLVEETRGVRAQVSAKKGYESTSTMRSHTYS